MRAAATATRALAMARLQPLQVLLLCVGAASALHRHFLLYKPAGVLSQFVMNGKVKQRHKFLGDIGYDFPLGCMAVGRLDRATEGLLLLTTDGRLSPRTAAI